MEASCIYIKRKSVGFLCQNINYKSGIAEIDSLWAFSQYKVCQFIELIVDDEEGEMRT